VGPLFAGSVKGPPPLRGKAKKYNLSLGSAFPKKFTKFFRFHVISNLAEHAQNLNIDKRNN
jgi:hypothetical protein